MNAESWRRTRQKRLCAPAPAPVPVARQLASPSAARRRHLTPGPSPAPPTPTRWRTGRACASQSAEHVAPCYSRRLSRGSPGGARPSTCARRAPLGSWRSHVGGRVELRRRAAWLLAQTLRAVRALARTLDAAAAAAATAAAAAGWLAGRKHAAPERRECSRSRRSGHIDTLNEEDLQRKKHTM